MSDAATAAPLVELRRDLHRHPEPAWREFYTTARIVTALRERGFPGPGEGPRTVDGTTLELALGPDAIAMDERMAVPDGAGLERWMEQARDEGADPTVLDRLADGATGAVATLTAGDGPHVGLRVDIDALPVEESDAPAHRPAAEGFRSEHSGVMHACGHDAHATIGVGVIESIMGDGFDGTLTVLFQPAEEPVGGGRAMAEGGHLDGVEALLGVHVGFGHPTGEVVAGLDGILAIRSFRASFSGAPAHAGSAPNEGRNAVQAMATAVTNLYGIPRHGDGATRVNAGHVGGGSVANIVPESAFIEGEVRGATTPLRDYAWERARRVLDRAARMHDCEVSVDVSSEAPSAESDGPLVDLVSAVASGTPGVTSVLDRDDLGASEDVAYLMRAVQAAGGVATFVCVGTDHPGNHHTGTFDVDEASIGIGVDVLSGCVRAIAVEGVPGPTAG